MQDFHSWYNPFCESVVVIMGLVECGDLISEDGEDSLGGLAGLKAGKERMRGQVFLSFTIVRFQSGVENGHKIGLGGGSGRGGGHDGSWRLEKGGHRYIGAVARALTRSSPGPGPQPPTRSHSSQRHAMDAWVCVHSFVTRTARHTIDDASCLDEAITLC